MPDRMARALAQAAISKTLGKVHSALSGLGWTASGHTGTASRIAGFDGTGAASEYQTGTGAGTLCTGNDSRLSDARTPTAHASTHRLVGGSDPIPETFLYQDYIVTRYFPTKNSTWASDFGESSSTNGTSSFPGTAGTSYWNRFTTAAGAGNKAGRYPGNPTQCPHAHRPILSIRFCTGSAIDAHTALWLGMVDPAATLPTQAAAYTKDHACLRFVGGTDTNFQFDVGDGTNQGTTDSGITPAASTEYKVIIDYSVSGTVGFALYSSTGTKLASAAVVARLPRDAQLAEWWAHVYNVDDGQARYFDLGPLGWARL